MDMQYILLDLLVYGAQGGPAGLHVWTCSEGYPKKGSPSATRVGDRTGSGACLPGSPEQTGRAEVANGAAWKMDPSCVAAQ